MKNVDANESGGRDSVESKGGKRSVIEVVVLGLTMSIRTGVVEAGSAGEDAMFLTIPFGSRDQQHYMWKGAQSTGLEAATNV